MQLFAIIFTKTINSDLAPPTTAHTLESNETKTGTLECREKVEMLKISHLKNVNIRKNRCTPVKLDSNKQDKKGVKCVMNVYFLFNLPLTSSTHQLVGVNELSTETCLKSATFEFAPFFLYSNFSP